MKPHLFAVTAGFLAVVALILLLMGPLQPKPTRQADDSPTERLVTVVGEGEVQVRPDLVQIAFGVLTHGASAAEAEALTLASLAEIKQALAQAGVPAGAVTVTDPLVSTVTHQDETGLSRIAGFQARSTVEVSLTDLRRVQDVIDTALAGGATSLDEVSYGLKEPEPIRQAAMRNALENARQRAQTLVRATGRRLGELLVIEVVEEDLPARTTTEGSLLFRARVRATYTY